MIFFSVEMNRHSVKLETRAPILSDVAVRLISEENLALAYPQGNADPGLLVAATFPLAAQAKGSSLSRATR